MKILETERLILREVTAYDAEFILELLNQPSYIEYIGDKGLHTLDEARGFIQNIAIKSYRDNGFGHYIVELKDTGGAGNDPTPIGTCGFVKRDELSDPDVGFAFLARTKKMGYGYESAAAIMNYGRTVFGFTRIAAITTQDNKASVKLLAKLGLKFERLLEMPNGEVLNFFVIEY